jgi:3-oxoacid CoA-transferase
MLRRTCQVLRRSKVFASPAEAVSDIQSGATILIGGFGTVGAPSMLCKVLSERKDIKDLYVISGAAALHDYGMGRLFEQKKVSRLATGHLGGNKYAEEGYLKGTLELEFTPLGSLAERMRAGGAGIPAFYTRTTAGTVLQDGTLPLKMNPDGTVAKYAPPKESRIFKGKLYVMEPAITGDVALIKASKVDEAGNCVFKGTSRNYNTSAAMAAKLCIVEAKEVVPIGALKPDEIHLPGVYVHRVVKTEYELKGVVISVDPKQPKETAADASAAVASDRAPPKTREELLERLSTMSVRDKIARRAAFEPEDGSVVNLGIGIPTGVSDYVPEGVHVELMTENGLVGMGPQPATQEEVDTDYINAGKQTIVPLPGSATFDAADAFAMIRGAHLDLTILGALQVAANGDLANWIIPKKMVKGPGGAMDLVSSGCRVVVTMEHCAPKKTGGASKIKRECTLPLTSARCVDRVITELAVFDIDKHGAEGMTLIEVAPGVSVEDVKAATEAPFKVSDNLKEIEYSWM